MATNQYFRNNGSASETNEQRLMEDLMVESTQIYGEDVFYLKRESEDSIDLVFGEDPISKFEKTFAMEMFVVSAETWSNGNEFFTKFGLQVDEETTLAIPRRTWEKYVPNEEMTRPREGDLIWVPIMAHLFEIKFVEHEVEYFQLGRRIPMMYQLKVEKYRYSQEEFDTGIDEIDDIEKEASYTIRFELDSNGTGDYHRDETVYQGTDLANATAVGEVSEWYRSNNNIDIRDIKGIFTYGANVVGVTSNVSMSVTVFNDLEDHVSDQDFQNADLEEGANATLVVSETNPFGMP